MAAPHALRKDLKSGSLGHFPPTSKGVMTAREAELRGTRRLHAALGALALALFFGAVALTWIFLKGGFVSGVPISAFFSAPGSGQQLPVGGDVKVRGVLVGRISDIRLDDDGNSVVEMLLNQPDAVPASSSAEIRSKTIFGQKWVELIPPMSAGGRGFAAGDVIPDERTVEPLELERALQLGHDLLAAIPLDDLSTVLSELADGFAGQEAAAGSAIDDGLVALRAVNARRDRFDLALRQLRAVSEWVNDHDDDVLSFMSSLDSANRTLVGAAPEFRSSLQSLPVFLDQLAAFQESTEDDLGRLVEDGADVAELVAARADRLVDLVRQLEAFTTVWNSGLSQPCAGVFESSMTCWQVYQLPGIESRGLYGRGAAPDADEPGDPFYGTVKASDPLDASAAPLASDVLLGFLEDR